MPQVSRDQLVEDSVFILQCLRQNGKNEEATQLEQQLRQREKDIEQFNAIVTKEMVQRPRDPALHCTLGQLLLRGGFLFARLR